jgi:hypothetical protein
MLGISIKNNAMPIKRKNLPRFIITSVVLAVNMLKIESGVNNNSEPADIDAMIRPKRKLYEFLIWLIFMARKMFSIEAKIKNQKRLPLIKYGSKTFQFCV